MKNSEPAIIVDGVSKSFRLPHERTNSLKGSFINFKKKKRGYENQHVLNNVSFEIKKGEFFGIVGRNGSGKSTLLKLISQIYTPDKGRIAVNGKLTPFIELGVGFNPELSGRDNVFLNGALLGFSRSEMEAMYDDIVEFAELERFMDQKLKNYSSGMQVRLAFSIAIRGDSDILVLDEVLAVGDASFQQKCFDYFSTLRRKRKTVVLVSHSMSAVERFCTRAILLDAGSIVAEGESARVASAYEQMFIDEGNRARVEAGENSETETIKDFEVGVRVLQGGEVKTNVRFDNDIGIRIQIRSKSRRVKHLNVGLNICSSEGTLVFSDNVRRSCGDIDILPQSEVEISLELANYYTNGRYTIDLVLVDEAGVGDKLLFRGDRIAEFNVLGRRDHVHSAFHPPHKFSIIGK